MRDKIKIGIEAPDFVLKASNGEEVSISDYRGKNIVLYFYPKDNTSGCAKEASEFRDEYNNLEKENTVALGISRDGIKSHIKFAEKLGLPFLLLSDDESKVCELYDVLKLKKMFGKEYMGIERSTFIIDKEGKIASIFRKVKLKDHIAQVVDSIKEINS
ncbi:thioredoxin-dependent thiol peroxidase [Wukongibacter sp. M2B1]|uniref:thioredoxin-dependent thiol peroxidase n=1 Tax=Wukongibacter sp. M2B1 TaxID=3088895 RepID=UPI003D7AFDA5